MGFVKKNKLRSIFSLIILLVLSYLSFTLLFPPTLGSSPREVFIVKRDSPPQRIISNLYKNNFIKNERIFALLLKEKGGIIQPGEYLIAKNNFPWQILNVLTKSPSEIWITIPEGLRKEEVASILQKKLKWNEKQKKFFLKNSQEGYLFPETYLFGPNSTPDSVIERLENQFQKEYNSLSRNRKEEKKDLIIASLIQREAGNKEEMEIISGIIRNRLKASMPLDIDATLQYIIGKPENWWPVVTITKDRKINSPFNTYLHKGLPPQPICNPGKEALESAIHPRQTKYFYYLSDKNKNIHYAETYQEHLRNVKKYLKD